MYFGGFFGTLQQVRIHQYEIRTSSVNFHPILMFKGSIWGFLGVSNPFPSTNLQVSNCLYAWVHFGALKTLKNTKKRQKNAKKRQKTPKNTKIPTKTQKLGQVSIVQSLGTKMGAFCKNQIFSNLSRFPITRKPQF